MTILGIDGAIQTVYNNIGYIKKTKSQGLNYSFLSEAQLIEKLRPEMVEAGIIFSPQGYKVISTESFTTAKGSPMNRVIVLGTFCFSHPESGTHRVVEALGEAMDSGDKATNKAMTGAMKYALRQTFCLETGDDPDKSPSSEQERSPKEQKLPLNKSVVSDEWITDVIAAMKERDIDLRKVKSVVDTKGRTATEALTRWGLNKSELSTREKIDLLVSEASNG